MRFEDETSPHGHRTGPLEGDARLQALALATTYRGDVTLHLDDGTAVTGYVFALDAAGSSAVAHARMLRAGSDKKHDVPVSRISEIEFSGEDTAAGKSWRAWQERYGAIQRRVAESAQPD